MYIQRDKLAILGGGPVRDTYLSYGRQLITEEDIESVVVTLRSPFLTQGPKIKEFESQVAQTVGAKYAVAFSNGTAALHGACFAAGISIGDEVITTPMTFAASANCVRYCGGTVVFADIQPDTYNIDPDKIRSLITDRTKAIIPVDFTGQPADIDEIMAIANEYGLVVIEDAAHSLGATYKGRSVGSLADMTMFSFHPVKHITTGEGGIITTNSEEYYQRLLKFRSHGITRDQQLFQNPNEGPWYYEMQDLGYNYRMTDLQASLGVAQISKLGEFVARRKEIAEIYNHQFQSNPYVITPFQKSERESSWHLYVIQLKSDMLTATRKEIYEALIAENIGVNVHYIPVHLNPYYQQLGYKKGLAPIAENLYEHILTLPLFPAMGDQDVQDVINAVEKVLDYFSKDKRKTR
ncbi:MULTISPECIES: UDP-4-amino-4,6-dideoxy-N-acetyl-beta-L-altrosamine transaminase [Brevibacillus]|uniref:UDP-4-amino-4, 6-dideoxy-N-acetyl-beta-L-altrosamine transaminase n=1 Tax=Brevibacillus TaxID=55080 RepID=UPI000271C3B4|nr:MULTISPECIES: UDP-4-amino-4,6-dideoxy-N-acetyl-beta-L-altrosamine transaminase [Brevibacillus]EJL46878.1 UDP-4-keto-6-deoxy-N-acetylglucosamine 4-aminotransferase [Brevibacillus sp. CF112]MED1822666.1 UDP-4-amino-4,6-dideoxy-N-acetyl-beta-L-altrosamine transaminase [Brevibacillus agri]